MILTLTTPRKPATDLGWLLHKNPAKVQSFNLSFGQAHVFYPAATEEECTAALVLDIDPIDLVRGRKGPGGESFSLHQYVNDRPFVASSFMSVAIAQVFGSALRGRCNDRPELINETLPLNARIAVLPCRGGESLLQRLFEPLGYELTASEHLLDADFPDWGLSNYYTVSLRGEKRLQDLLTHLYVLIPVLDNEKHYWVGDDEVDKLLQRGEGWLAGHPEREFIARRYLKRQHRLVRDALARISDEDHPDPEAESDAQSRQELVLESNLNPDPVDREELADKEPTLNEERLATVLSAIRVGGAQSIIDLGCGEGKLLRLLLADNRFERIVGMDVSLRHLRIASDRLRLDRLPAMKRRRIELIHGSLMYRDDRLAGFDAATCVEVIEHLDAPRLAAFERVVFEFARPRTVIVTTPNREYNAVWESLPAGRFRHRDHRFEWTRAEFQEWAERVASEHRYVVRFLPIGPVDDSVGSPTQMGVFSSGS
jgi:3' terminal RNA ribose 2'-O-methyltransferase Hen1